MIAVITQATGNISNSFMKYLRNIHKKEDSKAVHKITTLGTAHIIRRVLILRYNTLIMGNNTTCTVPDTETKKKAVTPYTPEKWFVSSI